MKLLRHLKEKRYLILAFTLPALLLALAIVFFRPTHHQHQRLASHQALAPHPWQLVRHRQPQRLLLQSKGLTKRHSIIMLPQQLIPNHKMMLQHLRFITGMLTLL